MLIKSKNKVVDKTYTKVVFDLSKYINEPVSSFSADNNLISKIICMDLYIDGKLWEHIEKDNLKLFYRIHNVPIVDSFLQTNIPFFIYNSGLFGSSVKIKIIVNGIDKNKYNLYGFRYNNFDFRKRIPFNIFFTKNTDTDDVNALKECNVLPLSYVCIQNYKNYEIQKPFDRNCELLDNWYIFKYNKYTKDIIKSAHKNCQLNQMIVFRRDDQKIAEYIKKLF